MIGHLAWPMFFSVLLNGYAEKDQFSSGCGFFFNMCFLLYLTTMASAKAHLLLALFSL